MGKAARQRRRRRIQYLVKLSYSAPDRFADSWERRIDSWLMQVRKQGRLWASGKTQGGDVKIFDFVDEAMHILSLCSEPVKKAYAYHTYEVLSHACGVQVALITDKRLYNTSNLYRSLQKSAFYKPQKRSLSNE